MILGCGYTGERLAACLRAEGARVVVTARRAERASELAARLGVEAVVVEDAWDIDAVARAVEAAGAPAPRTLGAGATPLDPAHGPILVDSVPPDPSRGPHAGRVVEAAARAGARRIVYLGSTGVYPLGDGSWVDEETPVGPEGPRGRARLTEEQALLAAADARRLEAVVLRIAAIYGPGRGVAERMRRGSYRVPGDGSNWVSRIHVHDLVTVVRAVGTVAPLARRVYVVADDAPQRAREHADEVAARLGLPSPPSVPLTEIPASVADLVLANRRVRNRRMKAELGVVLRYPSWRDALDDECRNLADS